MVGAERSILRSDCSIDAARAKVQQYQKRKGKNRSEKVKKEYKVHMPDYFCPAYKTDSNPIIIKLLCDNCSNYRRINKINN